MINAMRMNRLFDDIHHLLSYYNLFYIGQARDHLLRKRLTATISPIFKKDTTPLDKVELGMKRKKLGIHVREFVNPSKESHHSKPVQALLHPSIKLVRKPDDG